jgi:hypothetical protein
MLRSKYSLILLALVVLGSLTRLTTQLFIETTHFFFYIKSFTCLTDYGRMQKSCFVIHFL